MNKRNILLLGIIFLGIVLVCLVLPLFGPVIGPPILRLFDDFQNMVVDPQRHALFCDQLKTDLPITQVHKVLSQFGSYQHSLKVDDSGITTMSIDFDNPDVNDKYGGGFVLIFQNGKYQKGMYAERSADSGTYLVDYSCE